MEIGHRLIRVAGRFSRERSNPKKGIVVILNTDKVHGSRSINLCLDISLKWNLERKLPCLKELHRRFMEDLSQIMASHPFNRVPGAVGAES